MSETSDDHPPCNPDDARVEALMDEFVRRYRDGERPTISEYARQHPDVVERIRELFPGLVYLGEIQDGNPDDREATERESETTTPGVAQRSIGEYRLIREIGHGGMGVVYEAEQESLGRRVALKVLPFHALVDPRSLERFRRETRAAGRLQHPNIAAVYEIGREAGVHYYAMQLIRGDGLDRVLAEVKRIGGGHPEDERPGSSGGRTSSIARGLLTGHFEVNATTTTALPPPASRGAGALAVAGHATTPASCLPGLSGEYFCVVARIGLEAADALACAHGAGVLHRDIKPSNLMLDVEGSLWITDFGLADLDDAYSLTRTGEIVGTLRYMAPERLRGESDPRSDVYSLGMTLYELLTLEPAFPEMDRVQLVGQILSEIPERTQRGEEPQREAGP
jgi:serine/threonine protein kinase